MKSFILCIATRFQKELDIFMSSGIKSFITIQHPRISQSVRQLLFSSNQEEIKANIAA